MRYHVARDFAELDAVGKELEWVKDGSTFSIMLGIRYLDLLPAEAEHEYLELVRVFGKPVVDQVGGRLLAARRTKGRLDDLGGHREQMARPWINEGNLPAHGKLTEDQGEGDCGVARLGRCRWLSQTDSAADLSQTTTVWLSDEVPGGLVRQVTETRARTGSASFFEVRLENWTGTRDPAAKASALDALARAYPPSPRSTSAPTSYPPLPSSVTGEAPLSAIPGGTVVVVRTKQPILYDTARIGSTFAAELAEPRIQALHRCRALALCLQRE